MRKKSLDKLDSILKENKKKKEDLLIKWGKSKKEEEIFMKAWRKLKINTISQILTEIILKIVEYGHAAKLHVVDEAKDNLGNLRDESIALIIYRKGYPVNSLVEHDDYPQIKFTAIRQKRKVWIFGSTMTPRGGGMSGTIGHFTIDELKRSMIENIAIEHIAKIFNMS